MDLARTIGPNLHATRAPNLNATIMRLKILFAQDKTMDSSFVLILLLTCTLILVHCHLEFVF